MSKKYDVEELKKLTVEGLKVMCKKHGLPCYKGKSKLTKTEMIENLLTLEDEPVEEVVEETEERHCECKDECETCNCEKDTSNVDIHSYVFSSHSNGWYKNTIIIINDNYRNISSIFMEIFI